MSATLRERIGGNACRMAAALAAVEETISGAQTPMIQVGPWTLPALRWDDATRAEARRARDGFAPEGEILPRRGRGDAFWRNNVHIMKFCFIQALAAGWQATRDEAYAIAARDYVEEFMAFYPKAPFCNAAVRLATRLAKPTEPKAAHGGWLDKLPYFFDSPVFDDALIARIVDSARAQLAWQSDHIVPHPGNIRLFQANTFLWAGLTLALLPEAESWLQHAREIYADTHRRDLEPDGSHCEHEPNYHGLYQSTYDDLQTWQKAFPEASLPIEPALAVRVMDYGVASRRPNGQACGLQEGKAAWTGEGSLAAKLARRARMQRLAGMPETPPPLAQLFPDAGQVFLRDSWEPDATYVTFDATRWGGAHSHLGRNGVQLHAFGRTLVARSGSLSYAMGTKANEGDALDHLLGPYGKSTRAGNTLNLNGWNQSPTNPDWLRAWFSPRCHVVASRYSGGYWPGDYEWWFSHGFGAGIRAEHDRILVWLPGRAVVVIDTMMRWEETALGGPQQQSPSLEMNWQLSPGPVALDTANHRLVTRHDDANVLMLFPQLPIGMALSLHEGETEPPRGWISTGGEAKRLLEPAGVFSPPAMAKWKQRTFMPAPLLSGIAAPMEEHFANLITVMIPFRGQDVPEVSATANGTGELTLAWGDGATDTLTWTPALAGPLGRVGTLRTDAALLHLHRDPAGKLTEGTAVEATRCTVDELAAPEICCLCTRPG